MHRKRECRFLLLMSGVLWASACSDGGEYQVVVRFDPPALAAEIEHVDLALVGDCSAQNPGDELMDVRQRVSLRRGAMAAALGEIEPGSYGLAGAGRTAMCELRAFGCTPVTIEAGGSGELVVTLAAFAGEGCAPSDTCDDGVCIPFDAGVDGGGIDSGVPIDGGGTDGASDTGIEDGGVDTGVDACMCPACSDCVGGVCMPDHSRCGATEYCDPIGGCMAGAACGPMGRCSDDGNQCTMESCDTTRDPALCISDVVPEGTMCSGGTCHSGACCTGCFDGAICQPGTAPAACGSAGRACTACACPTNACSGGACVLSHPIAYMGLGGFSTCAIDTTGVLFCWGDNLWGQLGQGTAGMGTEVLTPTRVGSATWRALEGGEYFFCGIQTDGSLWCWGENSDGQLGQGDTITRPIPTRVGSATSWVSLDGNNDDHICGMQSDGSLWCWGEDDFGQIGNGDPIADVPVPTRVGVGTFNQYSVGREHTCAIASGVLYCWGANLNGQLGLGDLVNRTSAVQVGTDTNWSFVGAGEYSTCAIKTDGSLWCWGENSTYELGLDDTTDRTSPVRVGTATNWTFVEGGDDHTCATNTLSEVYCWGDNAFGQLGLGPTRMGTDSRTPTRVGTSTWPVVRANNFHTCFLAGGLMQCTGRNAEGQLGVGDRLARPDPTTICFPL